MSQSRSLEKPAQHVAEDTEAGCVDFRLSAALVLPVRGLWLSEVELLAELPCPSLCIGCDSARRKEPLETVPREAPETCPQERLEIPASNMCLLRAARARLDLSRFFR